MKARTKRVARGAHVMKLNPRQEIQVKRLIRDRQELKYFSYNQAATTITTTATLTGAPFDVPQGDGDLTRDGDRLQWCGTMQINLQIVNGQGVTGDAFNNVRFIVLQWHPVSTAAPTPTVAQILQNGPSGAPDVYSLYYHDTRQCYKILYDKVYRTVGNANLAQTPNTDVVTTGVRKLRIRLTKKVQKNVQYTAGGQQATNRLFLLYVSDSALATHPTLAFMSKVFFRDI